MKVIEVVPGVKFEHPVELPNSTVQPTSKHVGHKSSGNGVKKPRNPSVPDLSGKFGKLKAELAAADHKISEANRTMLVLSPSGKRRFVKLSEYEAA